jgi:hypothetical protein
MLTKIKGAGCLRKSHFAILASESLNTFVAIFAHKKTITLVLTASRHGPTFWTSISLCALLLLCSIYVSGQTDFLDEARFHAKNGNDINGLSVTRNYK